MARGERLRVTTSDFKKDLNFLVSARLLSSRLHPSYTVNIMDGVLTLTVKDEFQVYTHSLLEIQFIKYHDINTSLST